MTSLGKLGRGLSAIALTLSLCLLTIVPAGSAKAADTHHAKIKGQPRSRIAQRLSLGDAGLGSFTPAAADPRLAAAFARSGLGAVNGAGGAFRYTPSGVNNRRAITVAVRARAVTKAEAAKALALTSTDVAPSAYNLGLSIGWKHFALSGDVAKLDGGLLASSRESADVGLAVTGKRWQTKLDVAADRIDDNALIGIDQSWSVGLGGTYALTHSIDLSGGVRYKAQHDQFQSLLTDSRRDSQAVYLGTTFRF
jgi:hypothetical protein